MHEHTYLLYSTMLPQYRQCSKNEYSHCGHYYSDIIYIHKITLIYVNSIKHWSPNTLYNVLTFVIL